MQNKPDTAGTPDDAVGEDWITAAQFAEERPAADVAPEATASAGPDAATAGADPFGLDQIAPGAWVERAAQLSAHLRLAVYANAPASEVEGRVEELKALLDRAHVGGFGVLLGAAVETTTEEPVEPLPAATYADTRPAVVVPLAYPFEIDGERYDQLEIRPPSFAIVERVTAGKASEIEMQADMAGVAVDVLRALRWPDAEVFITAARHVAPALAARRS